jgi:hypothetical protein
MCLYNLSIRRKFDISSTAKKWEGLLCECVIDMYFSYKPWTIQSIEVKLIRVKELSNLRLCTKFRISTLSRLGEMRIESCQNVSALPADKPRTVNEKK